MNADIGNSRSSYRQILKSSTMVGGAQISKMIIGIVSTKIAAILLGPIGIGLISAYQAISQLGVQLASLGVNQSSVREIALSVGLNDQKTVVQTVSILRRMCWGLGLFGAMCLVLLSNPVSSFTFGDSKYVLNVMLVSLIILFTIVGQGHLAVIQGLRHVADLVKVQVIG